MSNVAVVGTGYVGLVSAACMSELGHVVECADVDADLVARLTRGEVHIYEDGLQPLVARGLNSGQLSFKVGASAIVAGAEVVFLCLPTPEGVDGQADLKYVREVAREIGPLLDPGTIVVTKSTVPVGTSEQVLEWLDRDDIAVVSNPEFLREGTAVEDFMFPDRILIGGPEAAVSRVAALYQRLECPLILTDARSAELAKYASNSFLAMKLSFVNGIDALCAESGANTQDVLAVMGADPRIGSAFLQPGPGFGGSCFPKDVRAFVRTAEEFGLDFGLLRSTIEWNEGQFDRVVNQVLDALELPMEGAHVAVLGLAFKAGTDDTRESPSLHIIQRLLERGAEVRAFDPAATLVDEWPDYPYSETASALEAAADADALLVLTEWPEFAELDGDSLLAAMRGKALVDTRRILVF